MKRTYLIQGTFFGTEWIDIVECDKYSEAVNYLGKVEKKYPYNRYRILTKWNLTNEPGHKLKEYGRA